MSGAILALGITHFPPFIGPDQSLSFAWQKRRSDPALHPTYRNPENWPSEMVDELGDDDGVTSAARHRAAVVERLRTVRSALDAFEPDVVVIFGDDQYENFREHGVPAFCVQAYDDMVLTPWRTTSPFSANNIWGEPADTEVAFRGARQHGKALTESLLGQDFDVAYSYEPSYEGGLSHAFMNSILYLDYDRVGFNFPVLPIAINCYGRLAVSQRGFLPDLSEPLTADRLDPPSPSPSRCYRFGAACARALRESGLRVALVASASWSHGFLTRRNHYFYPDVTADLDLHARFAEGDYAAFGDLTLDGIEDRGHQELLNWVALAGAAEELGLEVTWTELITTYIFNSNKCFAILTEPTKPGAFDHAL